MKDSKTNRGFDITEFDDLYGASCSLQESSLAEQAAIWLGINDANPQIMAKDTPEGKEIAVTGPENIRIVFWFDN